MSAVVIVLGILFLVVVVVGLWAVGIYNSLVTLRNRFKNAFAQIDVQLKRRYDLIPNLVEVAKGYMAHERTTLEAVISARNSASAGLPSPPPPTPPTPPPCKGLLSPPRAALSGALVPPHGRLRGNTPT